MSQPTPLLQLIDWSVRFPAPGGQVTTAIDNFSFTLHSGESVGIVGESGSGKSMTALSLMQLLPVSAAASGQIIWQGGINLAALPEHALANLRGKEMGMVFQEPLSSLNPVMTCGEQVAEVLRTHLKMGATEAKKRALEWFDRVQLPDPARIYRAYPHELSGGQRQRVMIAMALCAEPQLLIADEPTTALDVIVQYHILELLRELRADMGIAVLFISHDLAVVRHICERVVVMQQGRVVEAGPIATVFGAPQHPYTRGLLACRPSVQRRQQRLPTVADFVQDETGTVATQWESEAERQARLRQLASQPIVLSAEGLHVRYATQRNFWGQPTQSVNALDDVSITLRKGECLGVVGESGSGKTTLGKALLRLVALQSGTIQFNGQELTTLADAALRQLRPRLQMVFQDPFSTLNPKLRIGQILREPLAVHQPTLSASEVEALVVAMLVKVGLDAAVLERLPKDFSGGQRQRIGLARALLLRPEVLICDESVSALDVSVQAQVLNLIKDLQVELGFSLLFISHDMAVIRFIADRIIVMNGGRITEAAEAETLFQTPKSAYTKSLLSSVL